MREREATESAATETAGSSRAAGVRDLRTLATQLGNAAFGKLMRTPLSDAIHAAGTGGWAPVFALLAHLNANQINQRLRALDTADLVALRAHLGEAPAADRPRISTALDQLLLWSDADATAIGNRYRTTGTYTVTETGACARPTTTPSGAAGRSARCRASPRPSGRRATRGWPRTRRTRSGCCAARRRPSRPPPERSRPRSPRSAHRRRRRCARSTATTSRCRAARPRTPTATTPSRRPGPQSFTVTQGAVTITGTYQQVLTSEAGKTAMMDRAVQRGVGNARSTFRDACKAVIAAHPTVTTLAQLAAYEVQIIPSLVNRIQVLTETDLTQPPAAPAAAPAAVPVP